MSSEIAVAERRPGECGVCPFNGLGYCYQPEICLRADVNAPTDLNVGLQEKVWIGPLDADPFAAFGPGTTKGGRAEAGWFEVGTIADPEVRTT